MSIFDKLASTNLDDVDTSFPVLSPGTTEWKVTSAEKKDSASGGQYFLFSCNLVSPEQVDTKGEPLSPGYPMRHMINLTASPKQLEKMTEDEFETNAMKDVCKFLDAIMEQRVWDETLESYIGTTFWAKTGVQKERTDTLTGNTYPEAAKFTSFIPKETTEA